MSVTVIPRHSGLSIDRDKPEPVVYPDAEATLVDGRGQLLVLNTAELGDLADVAELNARLVRHTVACYAEGEWPHTLTEQGNDRKPLA